MLPPHILAILGGLCQLTLAQQFNLGSELGFTEVVPDLPWLNSRQSAAVEAFDYSNPAVVDDELAKWEAKVAPGNQAIPICPAECSTVGQDPAAWAVFPDASALRLCNKPQLLDLAVFTIADGQQETNAIRACSADMLPSTSKTKKRQTQNAKPKSCIPASEVEKEVPARLETSGNTILGSSVSQALVSAGKQLAGYLGEVKPDCDTSAVSRFALTAENAVLGVYGGAQAHRQGVTAQLLEKVLSVIATNGISDGLVAELCVKHEGDAQEPRLGADYIIGVAASTNEDGLRIVQDAVRHWSNGTCITKASPTNVKPWATLTLRIPAPVVKNGTLGTGGNTTVPSIGGGRAATKSKRAECRYIRVVSGDGCASLASKCGISGADFTKYNPSSTLCSTLKEGQAVCCSSGTLPDLTPKPDASGNCASYTVQSGDYCAKIAATFQITVDQIEEYNKKTWGWNGCEVMWANLNICLSKGTPPMPAPVSNAICGPTVPNTAKPTDGSDIALLNPCPLNVCCNVWGQCGLSEDFCIEKKSKTGAPGTSALQNGCVSSCGMDIKAGPPVATDIRIGYFEAWNGNRQCLRSHVTQYQNAGYTHIHWAFANLTTDFRPDVSGLQEEFDMFKAMKGVKKIVSFGGWAFSTEAGTWPIFKQAVLPANRETFKNNVVKFVIDNGLDGADFDWEYPAAPDIDGVPAGDLQEGANYAKFLSLMRSAMPKDKTVSFAAPASYWYLKQFPIKTIAKTVDYIVYMTYDLHGQWDAGNPWATPGCPTGNCLRSHVNTTETLLSLAMITKAGVEPSKVIVGITSYGRSFHMAQKGCDGPNCFFTGNRLHSEAAKGVCTDTAGYISNAEIDEIIARGGNIKTWSANGTDYLVYNDLEWVAYMNPLTKTARQIVYHNVGFGGTTDWAIDLQSYGGDDTYDNPADIDLPPWTPCDKKYGSLDDVKRDTKSIPDHCLHGYIMDALAAELEKGIKDYDAIMKTDYDQKFGYFANAISKKWADDLFWFWQDHIDEFFNCLNAVPTDVDHVYRNESISCPPRYKSGKAYNIYLIPKDEKKLAEFMNREYGLDYSFTYGSVLDFAPCSRWCDEWSKIYGIPALRPDFSVPNPKDSVSKSIDNIRALPNLYRQTAAFIKVGFFDEEPQDVVDGAAVPVFMIQQAVKSMHDIYEAGKEIQKKEMENLIITCITAFLFILPGLGEALAAVSGIAMIARIAAMVAEVGGLATGAYDLATNKDNLAMGIFSFLLGFVGVKGALKGKWSDAALLRRKMSAKEIEGMGDIVKNGLNTISGLTTKVCKL